MVGPGYSGRWRDSRRNIAGLPVGLAIALRIWLKIYGGAVAIVAPFFDLAVRLTIAQALLASALVKLANWDNALVLATYEYPVSWMTPASAATMGVAIELIGGICLAVGLATRPAALAVATLVLISQTAYIPIDLNLFVLAFMALFMVRGAGALSFDRAIAAGLADSAVPFARPIARIGRWLSRWGTPLWPLAARLWLAMTLAISSDLAPGWANAMIFPSGTFAPLPPVIAFALIVPLVFGAALPLVALVLLFSMTGMRVMGFTPDLSTLAMLFSASFLSLGAGYASIDRRLARWLDDHVLFDRDPDKAPAHWPHVVVIGGGFGGLACVAKLRRLPVRITLVDRNNYHLFQPMLYQVATAALSPADIATPIRGLFRNDGNVRVLMGEVSAVDRAANQLVCGANRIGYDYLVVATGASHSYFGRDEWAPFAPGLKRVEDGIAIRARILHAFERAEAEVDRARIDRLLTFVIVGAGPTGVELAGAIAELARFGLAKEYRRIDPTRAKIILIQSADRVLPSFPDTLSAKAMASLIALGVDVQLESRVTSIAADHVEIGDRTIPTETVLWAAGVVASPAATWLGVESDAAGRILVDERLRVAGAANIFAIGDTAASNGWDGQPVPGLAPAAKQQGSYVSAAIRADLEGAREPAPFRYRHQGSLATIGRKSAVADFAWFRLHGAAAWWLWGLVHVGFLVGTRSRITVLVNWVWQYFTMRLGIRLITGHDAEAA